MREYLVFQLYGPLQAWGDVAVGRIRPTAARPTRSGLLGLLAAAAGVRREDEATLAAFDLGYGLAVRVDGAGGRMLDYHTVQVTGERKNRLLHARVDELGPMLEPGEGLNTILSKREYLMDAVFTAAVWSREAPPCSLQELAEALRKPRFAPFLGRRSCTPSLPFHPVVGDYAGLQEAWAAYPVDDCLIRLLSETDSSNAYADLDHGGDAPLQTRQTRDLAMHHGRRQFSLRPEAVFSVPCGAFRKQRQEQEQAQKGE